MFCDLKRENFSGVMLITANSVTYFSVKHWKKYLNKQINFWYCINMVISLSVLDIKQKWPCNKPQPHYSPEHLFWKKCN